MVALATFFTNAMEDQADQNRQSLELVQSGKLFESQFRRAGSAGILAPASGGPSERARFELFLRTLEYPPERLAPSQVDRVRSIWARASGSIASLRPPTAGLDDSGNYFLSWSFADVPDVALELTIHRDGRVEWFFSDTSAGFVTGTEHGPEMDFPPEGFSHLRAFRK